MSNIYFTSDWHLGHANIPKFRPWVTSEKHNQELLCDNYASVIKKKDIVYFLGDICFTLDSVNVLKKLPGIKKLVRGNHDDLPVNTYLCAFEEVFGILKYKGFWLSHAPIHPNELRGRVNLHGHVHYATIPDPNYINLCVDRMVAVKYPNFVVPLPEVHKLKYDPVL